MALDVFINFYLYMQKSVKKEQAKKLQYKNSNEKDVYLTYYPSTQEIEHLYVGGQKLIAPPDGTTNNTSDFSLRGKYQESNTTFVLNLTSGNLNSNIQNHCIVIRKHDISWGKISEMIQAEQTKQLLKFPYKQEEERKEEEEAKPNDKEIEELQKQELKLREAHFHDMTDKRGQFENDVNTQPLKFKLSLKDNILRLEYQATHHHAETGKQLTRMINEELRPGGVIPAKGGIEVIDTYMRNMENNGYNQKQKGRITFNKANTKTSPGWYIDGLHNVAINFPDVQTKLSFSNIVQLPETETHFHYEGKEKRTDFKKILDFFTSREPDSVITNDANTISEGKLYKPETLKLTNLGEDYKKKDGSTIIRQKEIKWEGRERR